MGGDLDSYDGPRGLGTIDSFRVALHDNLLLGLLFTPFWCSDVARFWLRAFLWLARAAAAVILTVIIELAFRNGTMASDAVCACVDGRPSLSMEFADPPYVQPRCTEVVNASSPDQAFLWSVCSCDASGAFDVGSGPASYATYTNGTCTDSLLAPEIRCGSSGTDGFRSGWLAHEIDGCYRSGTGLGCTPVEACCKAYLHARIVTRYALPPGRKAFSTSADEQKQALPTSCDPPYVYGPWVKSFIIFAARAMLLEPLFKAVARGKWCFKDCAVLLRVPLLFPIVIYGISFLALLSGHKATLQEALGIAADEDAIRSDIFSAILLNLLLWDLAKDFAWQRWRGDPDYLDELGLPQFELAEARGPNFDANVQV
mmetsp:Transcript_43413/g.98080  ORF Transcript_43413/g.98080 Transcript_43413/m.98080 type:complete len:371 (-) Transcript_43413:474-1586(-)|eukprot:CAMPEP_0181209048 /NCGR_PEP_ID=MMETSP1096-20121128/22451_1 /TAXON_ID=156174 ORGANISM="Chrysochromulina ericina, Strain CCMP281" /NCGR_SAMPLE_ID=MMETSP1096 /ASSEMBLY_ACC=CAM_ASM_000453 /LENGTH=370 /DNA_ID=CAMNT_0023300169 /DNA_START=109 /DNA_END=1221 /DNA_ORIENTATION=+